MKEICLSHIPVMFEDDHFLQIKKQPLFISFSTLYESFQVILGRHLNLNSAKLLF